MRQPYQIVIFLILGQALFLAVINDITWVGRTGAFISTAPEVIQAGGMLFIVCFAVCSSYLLRYVFRQVRQETEFQAQRRYVENINELMASVRSQRHDFVNHVQALYGLIKTGQHEIAREYIEEIYGEVKQTSEILSLQRPEVSALLQAKEGIAAARGIKIQIKVDPGFGRIPVEGRDLNRLLGNLVDNALDAVALGAESERYVKVELRAEGNTYLVRVSNSGPAIPRDMQRKIFEQGFSTKGRGHQGMGLYAVQHIASRYGGMVSLQSAAGVTAFSVLFPQSRSKTKVEVS